MKKLIIFKSLLHDQESVLKVRRGLMAALENWEVKVCNPADYDGGEAVCFIGTGGTEEAFRECFEKLKAPITLLSDSYHNSFAASFEIASFLEQRGIRHKLGTVGKC